MSWGFWLTAAVLVSVLFSLFGVKPRGARPVAGSKLMLFARIALVILIVLLFYFWLRGRAGG
jgi:hypothetical protein